MNKKLAKIIDGKHHSKKLLIKVTQLAENFFNLCQRKPCITVIIVGDDPASKIYVKNKIKTARESLIKSTEIVFPKDITEQKLLSEIERLNIDQNIDGILVQLPLPKHIRENKVIEAISPLKDVDGFHPYNFGNLILGNHSIVPCTPLGALYLIKKEMKNLNGKSAVIIGRSNIVGKPMYALLLKENCTVTIAHSKTKKLSDITKKADILIAAIGKAEFINKKHIKPNSLIIDVGINRITNKEKSKIVGDVMFKDAFKIASKITPVPGGVGPMTIACLMYNTVKLSFLRQKLKFEEKLF